MGRLSFIVMPLGSLLLLLCLVEFSFSKVILPLQSRQKSHHASKFVRVKYPGGGTSHYPLKGNLSSFFEYYLTLSIGNPPQPVNLQVDTGSTDLVVQGSSCGGCSPANHTYSCSHSKSCETVSCDSSEIDCPTTSCEGISTCQFEDDYGGGGSISGPVTRDTVAFPGNTLSCDNVYFGTIMQETGSFENPGVVGIVGFAYSSLSAWQGGCLFDSVIEQYKMRDAFSMCLLGPNRSLTLGDDSYVARKNLFQWVEVSSNPGWFTVTLDDAGIGSQSLNISSFKLNEGDVIVDSGTTLLIVPPTVGAVYSAVLQNMCDSGIHLEGFCGVPPSQNVLNGYCYTMTPQQIAMYPPLYFTLRADNSTLFHHYHERITIPPQLYVLPLCNSSTQFTLGIAVMADLPIILGDVIMHGYNVVFDKEQTAIGFGPRSTCPTGLQIQQHQHQQQMPQSPKREQEKHTKKE